MTFWIFPKLAIVVRTGTMPLIVERAITFSVSEKFATNKKPAIKTKLRIKLVFNDLAVAAISNDTASSLLATKIEFS
jgi:hypothetical protein